MLAPCWRLYEFIAGAMNVCYSLHSPKLSTPAKVLGRGPRFANESNPELIVPGKFCTSAAKASYLFELNRRHKCLLHPHCGYTNSGHALDPDTDRGGQRVGRLLRRDGEIFLFSVSDGKLVKRDFEGAQGDIWRAAHQLKVDRIFTPGALGE